MPGRVVRAVSYARPSPSLTPERRRSTSPQTSFRERCGARKQHKYLHQQTAQPPTASGES
ncbi:hypothetical protein CEE69_21760 [Rhodopirellula bahusiensis]|uniref:Uncharacterized protein n=1 Tax=Rhodopirellula bahusiensis TaxID=2014065 RepID=A0A2G1W2K2_9BACT|nr:hypothetical protein CEE69_21760 [Rhodopirellula bahusiensis]